MGKSFIVLVPEHSGIFWLRLESAGDEQHTSYQLVHRESAARKTDYHRTLKCTPLSIVIKIGELWSNTNIPFAAIWRKNIPILNHYKFKNVILYFWNKLFPLNFELAFLYWTLYKIGFLVPMNKTRFTNLPAIGEFSCRGKPATLYEYWFAFLCWLGHLKMSFYYLTSHRGQGGSILLVHYSLVVLKPAILIFTMVEVRYDHIPIYTYHAFFRTIPMNKMRGVKVVYR